MNKNLKRVLQVVLLGFVAISLGYTIIRETKPKLANHQNQQTASLKHQVVAYYFHGNARCQSCLKIERYSADTIKSKFAAELKDGALKWQVLNVEESANRHFIEEYQLYTKSLVLVKLRDGKQVKWKNLEKVWDYLGDPKQFSTYVESELRTYLSAQNGT